MSRVIIAVVAATVVILLAGMAMAQEKAIYVMSSAAPLVIDKAEGAPDSTIAFLERIQDGSWARTVATRKGFDLACTAGGGTSYTALVYRDGDGPTMRAAIEPGGLSAPSIYHMTMWSWGHIPVHEGPIAPDVREGGECERWHFGSTR